MKEINNLINNVKDILERTPGVLGLSAINEDQEISTSKKSKKEINNSIKVLINNDKYLELFIGIIINRNITISNISQEIQESIQFYLKKHKSSLSLKKLNIYIRGVK